MSSLKTPPRIYTFWELAADFEDAFRALIEQGHDLNLVQFAVKEAPEQPEPPMSMVSPVPMYTLTWTAKDGLPLPGPLNQALLDSMPVKPATPNDSDPDEQWTKINEYILLRTQAHLEGVC